MKVKDLIKELQSLDPETIVNYMDNVQCMPDYYDGACVEVGEYMGDGELRKMTVRRGTKVPKLSFYHYGFDDYFWEAGEEGIPFDKAYNMIDFQVDNMSCIDRLKDDWKKSYERGVKDHKEIVGVCARAQPQAKPE